MADAHPPEQLVALLSQAAHTASQEIGLLTSTQVARVLGRHRNWVLRNAIRLGGFRLPGSGEWRFSPRGVAEGILGYQERAAPPTQPADASRRSVSRRLSYPPPEQLLGDRPRRGAH
jgi:hypothetical protein